uniref:Ig-like domain-containing protein n=1 Tax=Chelonoidis abingdonii TaxID=106734 RepID=A0A8C0H445_CHEAB
ASTRSAARPPSRSSRDSVSLTCLVQGFFPEDISVQWMKNHKPDESLEYITTPTIRDVASASNFFLYSKLKVSKASWNSGDTYTCMVIHEALQMKFTQRSISKPPCPGADEETTSPSDIQVFLVPPSPAALYVAQNPMLTCLVVNLPSDSGLQVVWSREKPGSIVPEPLILSEQFNGTFTASSSMPIFTRDWEAGETFTCKVEHSELPSSLIKSISKKPGRRSGPGIYLLRPHNEELSSSEDSVSLTCLVQGFFPEDISVQWMKNHKPDESLEFITTPTIKDGAGDSNFFLYSKLKVSKASWNSGDVYTCMVIHEALQMKFTQRSVSKDSGK